MKQFLRLILLTLIFSCSKNPLGDLTTSSQNFCTGSQNNCQDSQNYSPPTPPSPTITNHTWPFDNAANYTFNHNYVEITGGKASLKQVNTLFSSFSGTHQGTIEDSGKLTIDTSQDKSLNASWTPQYSNLVAYWKMDGNWDDSIGTNNGNSIGLTNFNTNFKIGTHSGVLSGGYIEVPNAPALNPATSFTIGLWAKRTVENQQHGLVEKYDWAAGQGTISIRIGTDNKFSGYLVNGTVSNPSLRCKSSSFIHANQWYHLFVTFDGGTTEIKCYINGLLENTSTTGVGVKASSQTLKIGARGDDGSNRFNGDLDDVAIWNSALTSSEIQTIYNRQKLKYSGEYLSNIIDMGSNISWTGINPVTPLPFNKELTPSNESSSSGEYSESQGTLSDGLVGLWHLNEASRTTGANNDFIDSTGSNNCEVMGSVALGEDGILSKSATFSGSGALDCGSASSVDFSTDFTLSYWVKVDSFNAGDVLYYPISKGGHAVGSNFGILGRYPSICSGNDGALFYSTDHLYACSTEFLTLGNWHHVIYKLSGSDISIFLDGKLVGSDTGVSPSSSSSYNLRFGRRSHDGFGGFHGSIDEVAVWNRPLSDQEITNLYRRGANKIKYQVRTCADATCSTNPPWRGNFSELSNCTTVDASGNCSGVVKATSPNFIFANYPTSMQPNTNRYFQYKVTMEANENTACPSSSTCLPQIESIEVSPSGRYFGGSPVIKNNTGVPFNTLSDIHFTQGGSCSLTYQISSNNSQFYYYNGSSWTLASSENVGQSTLGNVIKANISSFTATAGTGNFYWKAFLSSNTTQNCEIDTIQVDIIP